MKRNRMIQAGLCLSCVCLAAGGLARAGDLHVGNMISNKVLVLGNSITLTKRDAPQGPWEIDAGASASAPDKDFAHLIVRSIAELNGRSAPAMKADNFWYVGAYEQNYDKYDIEEKLKEYLDWEPDILVIAIGENIENLDTPAKQEAFAKSFRAILDAFKKRSNPAIFVRGQFMSPNPIHDRIMKRCCEEAGGLFVSMDSPALSGDPRNYAAAEKETTGYTNGAILAHPGDRGMKAIADALFEAMQVRGGLKLGPGNGDKNPTAGTDKTLVSWVVLANTTQQGGSALTLESGKAFDGIVFGEVAPGKWMAGSDYLARTQRDQQGSAMEKAGDKALVQMAIVYQGNRVTLYRNGVSYASYDADNIDMLNAPGNKVVFGMRHEGANGQTLLGSVEDARIYDKALTADEIKKLEPDKESAVKPYAWWTFEKGRETDRMGRFAANELSGGAKIEGGRLVLDSNGATLVATAKKAAEAVEAAPQGLDTPAMPAHPPASWATYHLIHPFHPGWGGQIPYDPNCAFYWKGRYHLHSIYQNRDGYAFGHVSSEDMVHWKWHPTTLTPSITKTGMFSGTGFITKDGKPAIIYHGAGSGRNWIAYALDDNLEKWTKPEPLIARDASGAEAKFNNWDPDCWLNGDTYYALSGGGDPPLMKSTDLKNWTFLGPLFHKDYPGNLGVGRGEDVSCANMFKIGKKWMLLCISHGLGCRYYLGDFKDEKYLPDFHGLMSWNGRNYFAPESVLTQDGRRVMWVCLLDMPLANQGIMSLPRELELPDDGVLRIKPLRELESLRHEAQQEQGITVRSGVPYQLKQIRGDTLELEVTIPSPGAKEFGVDVLCDTHGEKGLRVGVLPESKTLQVGKVNAPFELKKGEDLTLRIFIDKNLVEVFANDRQAALAANRYDPDNLTITLFSKGADTLVKQVKSWKMKTIYPTEPDGGNKDKEEVK